MAAVALRIGEVARRAGLSVRALRHYDDLGLLVPSARSQGAQRLYAPEDVRRLLTIQHLKALGLSLAEVRAALDDPGFDAGRALSDHIAAVEARRSELADLLRRLRALQAVADAGWEEVLAVIALVERLEHPDSGVRVRAALDGGADVPLDTLLDRLGEEPDDQVAETVTWAVARHGPAAVGPAIERLAAPDPRCRLRMAQVLAKLGDPAAVPGLVATLTDRDPAVRLAAAHALGRMRGTAADAAVRLAAGSDDPRVRAVALRHAAQS